MKLFFKNPVSFKLRSLTDFSFFFLSNLLNSLEGEWFSVSESIRQLSLSGNSIDTLPHKMFSSFGRLVWLGEYKYYGKGNTYEMILMVGEV